MAMGNRAMALAPNASLVGMAVLPAALAAPDLADMGATLSEVKNTLAIFSVWSKMFSLPSC